MSRQSKFYDAIELARIRRNFVSTEDFWVTTKLAMTQVLYRPRQSRARTTGMRVRLGCAHDKVVHATGEFCCYGLG